MKIAIKLSFLLIFTAIIFSAGFVSAQYPNCTYHAYQLCAGNNIYWYDSCGSQQDLAQTCFGANIICKYGQCVYQQPKAYKPPIAPVAPAPIAPTPTPNFSGVNATSISFFAKQDQNISQWQKTVQAGSNSQIYFMISLVNNSVAQIDNASVSANIPVEVSSLGNLQINGTPVSGDIVSGVNIGSLPPASAKSITFEGKTQTFSTQGERQATAASNIAGAVQSDSLLINFNPAQSAAAAVSSAATKSGFWAGFWNFLKRWYLWILVGLVLIFLFVVVFKRLSDNN